MPRPACRALALVLAACPVLSCAQALPRPVPLGEPATKVYRQVMPDGSIVYSDKPVKGAKIDETITADPETNTWSLDTGKPPVVPPKVERTTVSPLPAGTPPTRAVSLDRANAEVMRAEMLLEDARKRQQEGVEPLPGERTGNVGGGSRLNELYHARQQALAEEVTQADAALQAAIARRDTLQAARR